MTAASDRDRGRFDGETGGSSFFDINAGVNEILDVPSLPMDAFMKLCTFTNGSSSKSPARVRYDDTIDGITPKAKAGSKLSEYGRTPQPGTIQLCQPPRPACRPGRHTFSERMRSAKPLSFKEAIGHAYNVYARASVVLLGRRRAASGTQLVDGTGNRNAVCLLLYPSMRNAVMCAL